MISMVGEIWRALKKYFHLFVSLLTCSSMYRLLCSDPKTNKSKSSKTSSICQIFTEVLLWTITHIRSLEYMQGQNRYGLCPYRNSYLFLLKYLKIENTENHIPHIPTSPQDLTNGNILHYLLQNIFLKKQNHIATVRAAFTHLKCNFPSSL